MTYFDIVIECCGHIKDRDGCRYTDCYDCEYFPVRAKTGKRICDSFEAKVGIPTDDYTRLIFERKQFEWLKEEIPE